MSVRVSFDWDFDTVDVNFSDSAIEDWILSLSDGRTDELIKWVFDNKFTDIEKEDASNDLNIPQQEYKRLSMAMLDVKYDWQVLREFADDVFEHEVHEGGIDFEKELEPLLEDIKESWRHEPDSGTGAYFIYDVY